MSRVLFLALVAFLVTESLQQDTLGQTPSGLGGDVDQAFKLSESDVVSIDLPTELGGFASIEVELEGEPQVLELIPRSVRAPGFRLRGIDAQGQSTEYEPGPVPTFVGTVPGIKGANVAGALLHDGLWARITFIDGSTTWIEPIANRVPGSSASAHVVYRGEYVLPGGSCNLPDSTISPQPFGGSGCTNDYCLTQIACDADFEFFTANGSHIAWAGNRIELIVNLCSQQFQRDVSISYSLTEIVVRSSDPDVYTATDALGLLNEFRAEWNANQTAVRDLAHLFTGRDLDGDEVGLAFQDVVCDPMNHYAVSQSGLSDNLAITADTTSHMLGLNWGASQCTCSNPPFTMNSTITGAMRFESAAMLDIIVSRNAATCLQGTPANDNCSDAYVVNSGTTIGSNIGATQDGSTGCGFNANLDVWYSYTPSFGSTVVVDTEGSTTLTDTVLSVHTGCPGTGFNEVACDDFSGTGFLSSLSFQAQGGTTYLIRVSGYGNASGNFALNIAGPPAAIPRNNLCQDAVEICPGEYAGTTESAGTSAPASCAGSGSSPDAWYVYTPSYDGLMILDTCDSEYDTALGVYSGCPASLVNEIACDDDGGPCGLQSRIELNVTAGSTYWIRVSGFSGASGPYRLSLTGPQCSYDQCSLATPVGTGTHYGTLSGTSNDGESSCGSALSSVDAFYEFTAPEDGIFFATTCGTHDLSGLNSGLDTVLSLHTGCPATVANQIVCDDDWNPSNLVPCGDLDQSPRRDSTIHTPILAGETVIIQVTHFFADDPDDFILNLGVIPANDQCTNAQVVAAGDFISSTTEFASNDGDSSCDWSSDTPDVWYLYQAACDGVLRVDTCGSALDTAVSIHSNCFTELACNDQHNTSGLPLSCGSGSLSDSAVALTMIQGQTVRIRVAGWGSLTGAFDMYVNFDPTNNTPRPFQNGDFAVGAIGWCFIDDSDDGDVDFSTEEAVVTGGDNGVTGAWTYVEQTFTTYDATDRVVAFDWAFEANSAPGGDELRWDLVDAGLGSSLVGGPHTLAGDNASGSVQETFAGTGAYVLRLGVFTNDASNGPGVATLDNVSVNCAATPGPLLNGDFASGTGIPWCFTDESVTGLVDFGGGTATVYGGNDGVIASSLSYIAQTVEVTAGVPYELSFEWSYTSQNFAGYDSAFFDLIDEATDVTAIAGPIELADVTGNSGTEAVAFTGSGIYSIRLGVNSFDNLGGPGVCEFDNVTITPLCPSPMGLTCTPSLGAATLDWALPNTYNEIRVYRDGVLVATLPGGATSFSESGLTTGSYVYAVDGECAVGASPPVVCVVSVMGLQCEAVSNLNCQVAGMDVELDWQNEDSYASIQVARDGLLVATLAGTATTFTDSGVSPGDHDYTVTGVCAALVASPADCTVTVAAPDPEFRRGDCNADGSANLVDVIWLLGAIFPAPGGTPNPTPCADACDGNDDEALNLVDAVTILNALFGLPPIPLGPPYPGCGVDPAGSGLDCAQAGACP